MMESTGDIVKEYIYTAKNSLEAMQKHVYYLSLSNGDQFLKDKIKDTKNGYQLEYNDKLYWVKDLKKPIKEAILKDIDILAHYLGNNSNIDIKYNFKTGELLKHIVEKKKIK